MDEYLTLYLAWTQLIDKLLDLGIVWTLDLELRWRSSSPSFIKGYILLELGSATITSVLVPVIDPTQIYQPPV